MYTISYMLIQAISILSIPVFTKLLTPADFGVYEVFNNTVRIIAIFLSLNLFNALYRFSFDVDQDKKLLFQFLLRTSLFSFLIGSAILFVFKHYFFRIINIPHNLFVWMLVAVFSNIVYNFFTVYNTTQQKSTRLGLWQFFTQLLRVLSAIIIIWFFSKNYLGRIAGENVIQFSLSIVIIGVYFYPYIGLREKIPNKNEIVKYAVSFIPIGLSSFALGYLDTIMINNFKGNNDAGLYSYIYKIALVYTGVTTSFITANRPKLFNLLNENKQDEITGQFKSMFKVIVSLYTFFVLFSAFGGKFLALNQAFYAGLYLMPILILSYVFSDINELYCFYLYYEKKIKYFYLNFAISALVNFLLNAFLIPSYGYQAAAYTTLVSYAIMMISTYFLCRKYVSVNVPSWYEFREYIIIIVIVFISNHLVNIYIHNEYYKGTVKIFVFGLVVCYLWRNLLGKFIKK